ncbi:uncharacterized protein [Henckelia pumila]|uniref:uncharacterized protein n=1 Tax=Henckelia pumila TaxID=405737 RepID=UPI003C6DCBD4
MAASASIDPKQKTVIGYPSMDRYHLSSPYPQMNSGYPVPFQPQTFPSSSSFHNQGRYPNHAARHLQSSNGYYYQQPYLPMMPDQDNKGVSFGRLMLVLMVVLVAGMCMMSLIMWYLFGTCIPEFEVSSLNVSNFSATNASLAGKWDARVVVSNANENLEIHFDQIRSSIFYRQAMIGISMSSQPFKLQKQQSLGLNVSVPAEPVEGENNLQRLLLPSLAQDQKNGVIVFSLRMALNANFTSTNIVYRKEDLRVYCENLQVNFSSSGEGTLTQGSESECLIRIRGEGDD